MPTGLETSAQPERCLRKERREREARLLPTATQQAEFERQVRLAGRERARTAQVEQAAAVSSDYATVWTNPYWQRPAGDTPGSREARRAQGFFPFFTHEDGGIYRHPQRPVNSPEGPQDCVQPTGAFDAVLQRIERAVSRWQEERPEAGGQYIVIIGENIARIIRQWLDSTNEPWFQQTPLGGDPVFTIRGHRITLSPFSLPDEIRVTGYTH